MARKRMLDIHELVFDPELVKSLKYDGLLVYEVLWGNADDFGGLELNVEKIKLWCGALKITTNRVKIVIEKLVELKKLIPYECQGKKYAWIKNFMKHQTIKNPSLPTIPLPEWITYDTKQYPSGKKYASYTVILEKIPVDYQYPTSTPYTNRIETNRKETRTETTGGYSSLAQEFLDHHNNNLLKKGWITRPLKMNRTREDLIIKRLKETRTLEELKQASDNMMKDTWEERPKRNDVVYCIGTIKKVDKLDHWLNFSSAAKKSKEPITCSVAMTMITRNSTTAMMEEVIERLPEDQLKEFEVIISKKDKYLRSLYRRAKTFLDKRRRAGEG